MSKLIVLDGDFLLRPRLGAARGCSSPLLWLAAAAMSCMVAFAASACCCGGDGWEDGGAEANTCAVRVRIPPNRCDKSAGPFISGRNAAAAAA